MLIFNSVLWLPAFRYMKLLPSLQARQFSAATGLSRLLIILGAVEPTLKGENVSEEAIQRQVGESTRVTQLHVSQKEALDDARLMVRQQGC